MRAVPGIVTLRMRQSVSTKLAVTEHRDVPKAQRTAPTSTWTSPADVSISASVAPQYGGIMKIVTRPTGASPIGIPGRPSPIDGSCSCPYESRFS
jgi:hypothetical protein